MHEVPNRPSPFENANLAAVKLPFKPRSEVTLAAGQVIEAANELLSDVKAPINSFRIQLNADRSDPAYFTFSDLARQVPHLARLGITEIYAVITDAGNSRHGYDVLRYELSPALGGQDGFEKLVKICKAHGVGLIPDWVPNHMRAAPENPLFHDLLEYGPAATTAKFLDVNWEAPFCENKILRPILTGHQGPELQNGKIQLAFTAATGEFSFHFYPNPDQENHPRHCYPVAIDSLLPLLVKTYALFDDKGGADGQKLKYLCEHGIPNFLAECDYFRGRWQATDLEQLETRRAGIKSTSGFIKSSIGELAKNEDLLGCLQAVLADINADRSITGQLRQILDQQWYRVTYWPVAGEEINYRRFFDINELIGVCVENPEVAAATLENVEQLVFDNPEVIRGFRIDHVDGLYEPTEFLQRFAVSVARGLLRAAHHRLRTTAEDREFPLPSFDDLRPVLDQFLDQNPELRRPDALYPFAIVVEKILANDERLPKTWPVAGETGYQALGWIFSVMQDDAGTAKLAQIFRNFTGQAYDPAGVREESKDKVLDKSIPGDFSALVHTLRGIGMERGWDYSESILGEALRKFLVVFPVYRVYLETDGKLSEHDLEIIHEATQAARSQLQQSNGGMTQRERAALGALELIGEIFENPSTAREQHWIRKFSQLSPVVQAKGIEDTGGYHPSPLSATEVGMELDHEAITVSEFHEKIRTLLSQRSLWLASGHDTKRGEDTRFALAGISEFTGEWDDLLYHLGPIIEDARPSDAPSAREIYFLLQNMAGSWPRNLQPNSDTWTQDMSAYRERLIAYMHKAQKEAKIHTSWTEPYERWEQDTATFIMRLTADPRFLEIFCPFQQKVARCGEHNMLLDTTVRAVLAPIFDEYQLALGENTTFVDPDNRQKVDYAAYRSNARDLRRMFFANRPVPADRQLKSVGAAADEATHSYADVASRIWQGSDFALKKQFFRTAALLARKHCFPDLERSEENYEPLNAKEHPGAIVAAAVGAPTRQVIAIVPRLGGSSQGNFDDQLKIPPILFGTYYNAFTGERIDITERYLDLAEVFRTIPAAILVPEAMWNHPQSLMRFGSSSETTSRAETNVDSNMAEPLVR